MIAAAIAAEARFICTHNVGDFPPGVMASFGLTAITPDSLLCQLIREPGLPMLWVHKSAVNSLAGASDDSTLAAIRKAGAPNAAALMEQALKANPDR